MQIRSTRGLLSIKTLFIVAYKCPGIVLEFLHYPVLEFLNFDW